MKDNTWARLLAHVTGLVNQELLLRNEYLAAENRILRAHLPARLRLTDPERSTLAAIGKRLGRKGLKERILRGKAGHDPPMVSPTCRPEVRRFEIPLLPGSATDQP